MIMRIRKIKPLFFLILLESCNLYCISAVWPLSKSSDIQLLHLFPTVINASDSNIPTLHSQALFNAAILLSAQYNIRVGGQFITGLVADTAGTETNAIDVACKTVSTSNIAGIVGPKYSRETPIIAGLGQRINIPVISYAATDPTLSDRNAYPTFYRTVPSDSAAALAITQLFLKYNWTSCIIIYQNDAFGFGGAQAITNALLNNNLAVVNTLVFDIITRRMRDNLKDVLTASSTRIVVLWITSSLVTTVLQDALDADVLGPNYVWIISSSFDLIHFNRAYYSKLIGLLTLEPTVASVTNAPINTTLLNAAYDLWKQYEPETFPGPSNVDDYALFAFDATWILIQSLQKFCSMITNDSSSCISPTNTSYCFDRQIFNSAALFDIINNITILGVSGRIQFQYNTTDRVNGSYYVAKNIQSSSNAVSFVRVLTYSDDDGWQSDANTQMIWPGNSLILPTGNAKLEGVRLRLGVIPAPQFTNVRNRTDAFGNTTLEMVGYIPDLLQLLQTQLKFIPDIHLTPVDRTYNGLIDDVANGVYDLLLGDVTVTATRREKVDFSYSIFDNSLRIIMRAQPDTQVELLSFLKPLSWDLWLLIFGILILTSASICILERETNEDFRHRSLISLCAIGVWFSCCNLMGRDVELQVRTGPGRLLFTALLFLSIVIVASYTANLASELTISKSKSLISGIDDIKNGKIPFNRIGLLVGTAIVEYYLTEVSTNQNYYPLYSEQEQYDALLKNAIDATFVDAGAAEYMTNNVYCNLTLIGDAFDKGSFGIAMAKGWLYEADLDVALLSLREAGVIEGLYRKWFQYKTCPDDTITSDAIEPRSLLGLFMLFGVVYVLSFLLFAWGKLHMRKKLSECMRPMIESCHKRYFSKKDMTNNSHGLEIDELQSVQVHSS